MEQDALEEELRLYEEIAEQERARLVDLEVWAARLSLLSGRCCRCILTASQCRVSPQIHYHDSIRGGYLLRSLEFIVNAR